MDIGLVERTSQNLGDLDGSKVLVEINVKFSGLVARVQADKHNRQKAKNKFFIWANLLQNSRSSIGFQDDATSTFYLASMT
jgi:hypothetical protein